MPLWPLIGRPDQSRQVELLSFPRNPAIAGHARQGTIPTHLPSTSFSFWKEANLGGTRVPSEITYIPYLTSDRKNTTQTPQSTVTHRAPGPGPFSDPEERWSGTKAEDGNGNGQRQMQVLCCSCRSLASLA